ncbi:MAG TPA: hypothetical protein VK890_03650, partial [Bacteroidia bacterium]|nr:hypothetical protein [Bacteroidia bacterium]
ARIQKEYLDDLSNKNAAWWQDKVKEIHGIIAKDSTLPIAIQCQRLLSFLSLAVYMGASHSFNSTDDAATAHFLDLYALVDPTNAEHSYLYASMYGRENNPDRALSSLQDAVRLGFNDLRRMQADPNFNSIKDKPEYKALVKKIEGMPVKIDVTQ